MYEENNKNILNEIGLTEGEIKVYTLLIKNNSMKAGDISKETKLNRSYLYKILESLIQKKLIFVSTVENIRLFNITRVDRIKELYQDKLNNLIEKEDEIKKFLSSVKQLPSLPFQSEFSIEVYEGYNEIKSIIKDVLNLKKGDVVRAFGKEGVLADFPGIKYWFDSFVTERVKKKIKFLAVYNVHKNARKAKSPLTEIRYANLSNIEDIEISFYTNHLLIYLMEKNRPRVVVLKSEIIVNTMKSYFDLLWEKSKTL